MLKYFPSLSGASIEQLNRLKALYEDWNSKINVISRKDMENFYLHHVLHSLAIARFISFVPGTKVLDVGTGGGFPGIPLAIIFPSTMFSLLDSIAKKITVVTSVADELGLTNVLPLRKRVEEEKGKYDFVISRAVCEFPEFVSLTQKNVDPVSRNRIKNGIICLKGGNLEREIASFKTKIVIRDINEYFSEPYFETKKIIYLPV